MSTPYMPLYVSDFDADTMHLTLAHDGAYNRLLRLCWRTPGCSVPDDKDWIAKRLRVSKTEYSNIVQPVIDEYFLVRRGRVFSKRQKDIFDKTQTKLKASKKNGQKGGRPPKPLENNKKDKSYRFKKNKPKRNHPEPEPEPYTKPLPPSCRKGAGREGDKKINDGMEALEAAFVRTVQ